MKNKLYFLKPKPEFNCEDMPVYLVIAKDEQDAFKLVIEDISRLSSVSDDELDEFCVGNVFNIKENLERQVIWGLTKIGVA